MIRIRILSGNQTGQIVEAPPIEAENAVNSGYAEYIYDEPEPEAAAPGEQVPDAGAGDTESDVQASEDLGPGAPPEIQTFEARHHRSGRWNVFGPDGEKINESAVNKADALALAEQMTAAAADKTQDDGNE